LLPLPSASGFSLVWKGAVREGCSVGGWALDIALQGFLSQLLAIVLLFDAAEMLHAFPPPSTLDTQI
jgi:hypothetical protein